MNKSYRLKIEEWIKTSNITEELLLICIAKLNPIIEELAYKEKKYAHVDYIYGSGNVEHIQKKAQLTEIRKPMMDVLIRDFHLSFEEIVIRAKGIPEDKHPTIKVCQQVSDLINGVSKLFE